MSLTSFGVTREGIEVHAVTLQNVHGIRVRILTYGAIIASVELPDRSGVLDDVVLGHGNIDGYINASPYFGAVVGRYGNRIGGGTFTLDNVRYELSRNEGPNTLHGGTAGFDKAVWSVEGSTGQSVRLTHISADGDQGFPGELMTTVTYTLSDAARLEVDYEARTNAPTIVNLTQHTYWNLSGAGSGSVLDHELMINASAITSVDAELIPTGELLPVADTPFDFREARRIGDRIGETNEQLSRGGGYDHNYVLDSSSGDLNLAARLHDRKSGRTLAVHTTEPGLQLYSGNYLDGSIIGKAGHPYVQHGGVCLETQHFPDSPNQSRFPSTALDPGAVMRSRTVFAFGAIQVSAVARV